mgnify:CR=1 FL=1
MNTIAILPGGREICPSPCKKTRRTREINIEEVDIGGKAVRGLYGDSGTLNWKSDLKNNSTKHLCIESSNLTLNPSSRQNIVATT